jgi:hypothetical protein
MLWSSGRSAARPLSLKTWREHQADRQKRSERLTSQLPSGQLHVVGAGERGQQKDGKARDASHFLMTDVADRRLWNVVHIRSASTS